MRKYNCKRLIVMMIVVLAMVCLTATTAFAAGTGDVAGAVESTWTTASGHPLCLPGVYSDGSHVSLGHRGHLRRAYELF